MVFVLHQTFFIWTGSLLHMIKTGSSYFFMIARPRATTIFNDTCFYHIYLSMYCSKCKAGRSFEVNKYREYVVCATMAPCDLKIRSKIIDRRYGEKLLWNIFQLGNNVSFMVWRRSCCARLIMQLHKKCLWSECGWPPWGMKGCNQPWSQNAT